MQSTINFDFAPDATKVYAQKLLDNTEHKGGQKYNQPERGVMSLISGLLAFSPNRRISAKKALQSQIFNKFRNENLECGTPKIISLGCDLEGDNQLELSKAMMAEIISMECEDLY